MYDNLEKLIKERKITKLSMAESMDMRYPTLIDKLAGKFPLSLDQAMEIKEKFFPDLTIEELFKKSN